MAAQKVIYSAPDEQSAVFALDTFDQKWSAKYPKIADSWRSNWANSAAYFKYPRRSEP